MPIPWKRFWCPRTGTLNLSDDGYLLDPDSEFGKLANPDVVPLDSILHRPCLALLGEPGIGKTHALQGELARVQAGLADGADLLLSLDLRAYTSEDRLCRALFDNATVRKWLRRTSCLHLFLDSLDEGLLSIETLAALLIDELIGRKFPVDRLYLRIACRTAEWRTELEEGLCALWGDAQFGAYELTPLRRTDAALAAAESGLNAEAFLSEIDRTSAVPLAIRPVTLKFLLEEYAREGQIPGSMTELYRSGCEILCAEQNERRQRRVEMLSASERMSIAGRLAAATIFANRDAIATRPAHDSPDASIADLTGGEEGPPDQTVPVRDRTVREVLNTGLFTSRGPGRMGWSHQTYAEFLAARHVIQAQIDTPTNLVLLSFGGSTGVIPQLRGTAAWMAGMAPEVFQAFLGIDPPLLLGADLQSVDEGLRSMLVDALLERVASVGRLRLDPNWRSRYARLSHPDIEQQLRGYITDPSQAEHAQELAIDIADACGTRGLADELATLVLDPAQRLGLRDAAARAVAAIGESASCAKLLPLVVGSNSDPKEDLKGLALRANWPDRMSAAELFKVLTPPRDEHYFGGYQGFILHELPRKLRARDLPIALEWVSSQTRRQFLPRSFRKLMDAVLTKATEACTNAALAGTLAQTLLARLRLHEEWVDERGDADRESVSSLLEDRQRRRRIISSTLDLPRDDTEARLLAAAQPSIVRGEDVLWLIGLLRPEASSRRRRSIAGLVGRAADLRQAAHCDAIISASSTSPELRDTFQAFLGAIEIGSPEAASMRDFYFSPLGPAPRAPVKPLLDPPPEARIRDCLEKSESDVARAWPALITQLTLEPDSTHYHDDWRADITTFPGWSAAAQSTREEILACAARYLRLEGPGLDEWVSSNVIDTRVVAGHRAIVLMARCLGLESLKPSTLRRWMPAIMSDWNQQRDDFHKDILRRAYIAAPRVFCSTLSKMIKRESHLYGHVTVTRLIEHVEGRSIERTLCSRLIVPTIAPEALRELGADLIRRGSKDGLGLLKSLVAKTPPPRGRARNRAVAAARALVGGLDDAGWDAVWPSISRYRSFGREIVSAWMDEIEWNPRKGGGSLAGLTEKNLADLFAWLIREFPYPSREEEEAAPSIRPIEGSSSLKAFVLRRLTEFATPAAVQALRDLMRKLPGLDWLRHHMAECEEHTLARSWHPPTPRQVIDVVTPRRKVLVQDGNHLLDLLMVSLGRLEKELQGETPAAELLWNETTRERWRPKREESLTDYIARHFRSDLGGRAVVANREVEVRRLPGAGRGSPTDIYVNAFRIEGNRRRGEPLRAIVEVKGCWNAQLLKAMETQLFRRYMKPAGCGHGLYVAGWYLCDRWDKRDHGRSRVKDQTMPGLRNELIDQARILSGTHGVDVRAFVLDVRI